MEETEAERKIGRGWRIVKWYFHTFMKWNKIVAENDVLLTEIRRVEKAIQALEAPSHIAKDCLSNRQRRLDTDLVQDNAENQLLKVWTKR